MFKTLEKVPNEIIPKGKGISVGRKWWVIKWLKEVECGADREVVNGEDDGLLKGGEIGKEECSDNGIDFCRIRSFDGGEIGEDGVVVRLMRDDRC